MSICEDAGFNTKYHKSVHAHNLFKWWRINLGIAIVSNFFAIPTDFKWKVKFIELKNIPQKAVLFPVCWKEEQ